jgi:pre-mRNA-splicing factor RBM22/SLT11
MTKLPPNNKLCQVSKLPMQSFRWKAGPTGRHKETVISYVVARDRNICQCCLMDLRFGLPAGVRDAILKQGSTSSTEIALPHSIPGLQQYYGSKKRAIEDADNNNINSVTASSHISSKVGGKGKVGTASIWAEPEQGPSSSAVVMMGGSRGGEEDVYNFRNQLAISQLERLSAQVHRNNVYHSGNTHNGQTTATPTTTAFRNLPKLCSFWLNGACNRVLRKTCPFRPCCGTFIFPEIIRTQKTIHEALVQRLTTEGPAVVMKSLDTETKAAFQQALKGVNREDSIKKRVTGDVESDELAKKYLNRLQDQVSEFHLNF